MPKRDLYLVLCRDYNGRKDVLFCMGTDDFRFGTENYQTISKLKPDARKSVSDAKTGRRCKPFIAEETGKVYLRFEDWSMRAEQDNDGS